MNKNNQGSGGIGMTMTSLGDPSSRRDYLSPRERLTDPAYGSGLAQTTRDLVDQLHSAGNMPAWKADDIYSRAALASKVGGQRVPTSQEMGVVQVKKGPKSS